MSIRAPSPRPFGEQLRDWRQRRYLSQLDLAHLAGISPRHMSFIETGRSVPSRAVVLRLSDRLEVPLRERNQLLLAAGYAPLYRENRLDDAAMATARRDTGVRFDFLADMLPWLTRDRYKGASAHRCDHARGADWSRYDERFHKGGGQCVAACVSQALWRRCRHPAAAGPAGVRAHARCSRAPGRLAAAAGGAGAADAL
nr:helix-turn-helix transcriptional regulator [Pseudoxanthomonas wuyuanensis]